MADSQGRHLGNDVLLYWADTAPTDAADDTDAAYDLVGLAITNDFNGEGNVITAADKAASGWTSGLSGSRSYSLSVEAHRKNVEDTGQAAIRDAFKDGNSGYWLMTTGVTGDTCVHGQGVPTSYSESNPTDEYATMSSTISGDGAPTWTTVPSET